MSERINELERELRRVRGDFIDAAGMDADEFAELRGARGRDFVRKKYGVPALNERIAELEAAKDAVAGDASDLVDKLSARIAELETRDRQWNEKWKAEVDKLIPRDERIAELEVEASVLLAGTGDPQTTRAFSEHYEQQGRRKALEQAGNVNLWNFSDEIRDAWDDRVEGREPFPPTGDSVAGIAVGVMRAAIRKLIEAGRS